MKGRPTKADRLFHCGCVGGRHTFCCPTYQGALTVKMRSLPRASSTHSKRRATLVVEEIFVPSVLHQLGDDHNNTAIGIFPGEIENELHDGNDHKAVG